MPSELVNNFFKLVPPLSRLCGIEEGKFHAQRFSLGQPLRQDDFLHLKERLFRLWTEFRWTDLRHLCVFRYQKMMPASIASPRPDCRSFLFHRPDVTPKGYVQQYDSTGTPAPIPT